MVGLFKPLLSEHNQRLLSLCLTTHPTCCCRGVFWDRKTKRWRCQLGYQSKKIFLGYFDDAGEAARAYDQKLVELRGAGGEYGLIEHHYTHPTGTCSRERGSPPHITSAAAAATAVVVMQLLLHVWAAAVCSLLGLGQGRGSLRIDLEALCLGCMCVASQTVRLGGFGGEGEGRSRMHRIRTSPQAVAFSTVLSQHKG